MRRRPEKTTSTNTHASPGNPSNPSTDGGAGSSSSSSGGSSSGGSSSGGSSSSETDSGSSACAPVDPGPDDGLAVCDPSKVWGVGSRLPFSGTTNDWLAGVTPDQKTLAWQIAGLGSTYMILDRASATDMLGIPTVLAFTGTANKISLSPDGLRVLVVNEDLVSIGESLRSSKLLPFGGVGEGAFSMINAAVRPTSDTITDPVISASDKVLAYTRIGASASTLWISTRASKLDAWPLGTRVEDCEMQSHDGLRKSPLAISNDARTLFFRDEVKNLTRVAYRTGADQAFSSFRDLPAQILSAIPNASCDRLYYSAAGTGLVDMFEAVAQ